jgi:dTDP-4-dehydrorhamnose 3,5-epimerase
MQLTTTAIPEVKIITPRRFGDHRGYFSETYNKAALAEAGIAIDFIQDNQSYSAARGTFRGFHFQGPPATQTKLVRVLRGAILDIVIDCRHGSPTFLQHVKVELTAESGAQILCPKGFAHGILTLEADTEIAYKVDAYYAPEHDLGIRWDDPDLGIALPLTEEELILSEKDRKLPRWRDLPRLFTYSRAAA